jgi:glycosyltransferase involved in cell wall biosynthesis
MRQNGYREDRVAFVITDGWTTHFLRGQLRALRERGLEPLVVAAAGPDLANFAREEGVRVATIDITREPRLVQDLRSVLQLVLILREWRPVLVNASTPKAALVGMLAAWLCRTPVRVHQVRGHRFETMSGSRARLLKGLERLSSRLATHVQFNSASLRTSAIEQGLLRAGVGVVIGAGSSNGVDVTAFRPDEDQVSALRTAYGIPHDAPVIGFLGRLVLDKGVVDLVEIFGRLVQRHADLRLLLIGPFEEGNPVPPATRKCIEQDPRIIAVGRVDDAAACYRVMDVLAFPSYREGLPNAVLEAQATCVPVVGYAATGTVDALEQGHGGSLVTVGDRTALESELDRYLSEPALRREQGVAGRARVMVDFDQVTVWSATAISYREWIGSRRR